MKLTELIKKLQAFEDRQPGGEVVGLLFCPTPEHEGKVEVFFL